MKKLYFLHIPKTGGTSVKGWITEPRQTKCLKNFGWEFVHLGHSYFKDTVFHGVRPSAGILLKDSYPEKWMASSVRKDSTSKKIGEEDIPPTIEELKDGVVFAISRSVVTWLPSYFSSGCAGWHQCQWANKITSNSSWKPFFAKFHDSYVNGFPWYHESGGERFPATEWTRSNIWQMYDNDENILVDYVINFENLSKGIILMLEDLGVPGMNLQIPHENKNPLKPTGWTSQWETFEEKILEGMEHYKDSREFFTDSSQSLFITERQACI